MANLIDKTFFVGTLEIAQLSEPSVEASLTILINEFEPKYFEGVLGYEMYKKYLAGILASEARMIELRDGKEFEDRWGILRKWKGFSYVEGNKKSPIANFVYYWYLRHNASITTGSGEKKATDTEVATVVSSIHKQCAAYNEMVRQNEILWEFLYSNQDVYPEFFVNYPYLAAVDQSFYIKMNPQNI